MARKRGCIQPVARSSRMPASTSGKPVRPLRQASRLGWLRANAKPRILLCSGRSSSDSLYQASWRKKSRCASERRKSLSEVRSSTSRNGSRARSQAARTTARAAIRPNESSAERCDVPPAAGTLRATPYCSTGPAR